MVKETAPRMHVSHTVAFTPDNTGDTATRIDLVTQDNAGAPGHNTGALWSQTFQVIRTLLAPSKPRYLCQSPTRFVPETIVLEELRAIIGR